MSEAVDSGVEAVAPKRKRTAKPKVITIGVDNTPEDVLQYQSDGSDLHFDDMKNFLKLPESIVAELKPEFKTRYRLAQAISRGDDVIGGAVDGQRGFSLDYDVQAGSAAEKTAVANVPKGKEVYWGRMDKLNKHLGNGFKISEDKDIVTRYGASGSDRKFIGGQRNPEMVLLERPVEVGLEVKARQRELKRRLIDTNKSQIKEDFSRAGVKLVNIDE